jgi:SsrA-binding protein
MTELFVDLIYIIIASFVFIYNRVILIGMAKKNHSTTKKISNKRARFDYELGDEIIAGISLSGKETKSLRLGHGHLRGSFINVRGGEVWLTNATITNSPGFTISDSDQNRDRKLLLKKKEIEKLIEAKNQGRTIVPLELLTGGRYIKVRLATGKGRKNYDKRESIKKRDQSRDTNRILKAL